MAKKVLTLIKLQIPGGQANPAPPVGPALGQHGVNIMEFCKAFNAQTAQEAGRITPVEITVYEDRSFTFITKTPPAAVLIKQAIKIQKGSGVPHLEKVGKINGIDVASRMAATMGKRPAPASAGSVAIPGPSNEQLAAAGSIPPGEQRAMAEGMVAKLEARLETDPSNIDGWMMLMRSRKTLGQDAAAASALTAAIAANPSRKSELEAAGRQLGISR